MNKNYVIAWTSKITGFSGQGGTKFSHTEALKIIDDLNKSWTDLFHYTLIKE